MTKKMISFFLMTVLLTSLLVPQAMAVMLLCERPCSDGPTEHILDGWREIESWWEDCTQHSDCTIRYMTYGKNYKCTICGYHHSHPEERKTVTTHNALNRAVVL